MKKSTNTKSNNTKNYKTKSLSKSKSKSESFSSLSADYKKFEFNPIQELYTNELFSTRMINPICDIVQKYFDKIPQELIQNQNNAYKKLLDADKSFKKSYSKFKHTLIRICIPFGLLLFVYPGILLIRKNKALKFEKEKHLANISENESNTLKYNKAIGFLTAPRLILKEVCEQELKYFDMGPINNSFVKTMSQYWGENLPNFLKTNEWRNTLNTSWGVFNNNIVINLISKTHDIKMKQYSGSITVPYYTRDTQGNLVQRIETVVAYYSHPFPFYEISSKTYCYSERAPKLNFSYDGYFTGKLFNKKSKSIKKTHNAFENPDFEKHYLFNRNDEVGIRTVFTPYVQEQFLKLNNFGEPDLKWQLNKSGPFYYSNLSTKDNHEFRSIESTGPIGKFLNNPRYSFESFVGDLKNAIISKSKSRFDSLAFMTLLQTIQSEDQTDLANELQKGKFNDSEVTQGDKLESFYVMNSLYSIKHLNNLGVLKKLDTSTMQYFEKPSDFIKVKTNMDTVITVCKIKNYTYKGYQEIAYIPTFAPLARTTVTVPVSYVDYIRGDHDAIMIYSYVPKNLYFHSWYENNLSKESFEKFETIVKKYLDIFYKETIVIKDGTIAVFLNDPNSDVKKATSAFTELLHFFNHDAQLVNDSVENVMKLALGASLLMTAIENEENEDQDNDILQVSESENELSDSNNDAKQLEGFKMKSKSLTKKDVTVQDNSTVEDIEGTAEANQE